RGALHLPLADRHVPRAIELRDLVAMAGRTGLYLRCRPQLGALGLERMDAVTRRAGEVPGVVHAAVPERVLTAGMAREARRAGIGRLHLRERDDRAGDRRIVHVVRTRAVAALAALLRGRGAGMVGAAVGRIG